MVNIKRNFNYFRPRRKMRILVTTGPTYEPIDPIRFISNYSTGKMGYEIAKVARRRKHKVILICGPTQLLPPAVQGIKFVRIKTAIQMKTEVEKFFPLSDCLIMASAVSDYRPKRVLEKKLKRKQGMIVIELVKNPDILLEIGKKKGAKILVGFALESGNLMKNALTKLKEKNLDFIIANRIERNNSIAEPSPFGCNRTAVIIIDRDGKIERLDKSPKSRIAEVLLDKVEGLWYSSRCQ